jgi:uncharacterized membrane protein
VRSLLALAGVETGRLETFSDGVFAIAITLLVLLFDVPDVSEGRSLGHVLARQWPSYASYAVSFITIGIIWVNHHTLFRHIVRVDRVFLFINVLFLMCVAFLPYPTAVIARYVRSDDATAAAVMYGLSLTATAICFNVLWQYAARGYRLLAADADRREVAGITRSYWPGAFLYAGATGIAFASATASVILFILLALFYVLSSTLWSGSAS